MVRNTYPARRAAIGSLIAVFAVAEPAPAQHRVEAVAVPVATAAERLQARVAELRVTDARLAAALEVLVAASPTAARALEALEGSGLPVTIGTPAQLTALPDSAGGPDAAELRSLLALDDAGAAPHDLPIASVIFRAAGAARDGSPAGAVRRVWVAVEVDSVEAWIRVAGHRDAETRIHHDLLAILAHEFVAHVGSVAATRRMESLCDDPSPQQQRRSAEARSRGERPPLNGEMAACSLRVENRVRSELNRALRLRGSQALPPRYSYTLEVMHFERARIGR
jgi:hypothetical protein